MRHNQVTKMVISAVLLAVGANGAVTAKGVFATGFDEKNLCCFRRSFFKNKYYAKYSDEKKRQGYKYSDNNMKNRLQRRRRFATVLFAIAVLTQFSVSFICKNNLLYFNLEGVKSLCFNL